MVLGIIGLSVGMLGCGKSEDAPKDKRQKKDSQSSAPVASRRADPTPYVDKNKYFEFLAPEGWTKKEFPDPRTKVSFDVPSPIPGQNKAGIFFLSHPLSGDVSVRSEAENRVVRLKEMGAADARVITVEFAGVKAEQVEGILGGRNTRMRVLMFTNYGRIYVISFTATTQDYAQYWPVAENALKTFKCLPPAGVEVVTDSDTNAIQKEKIRVLITALKEPGFGTDAFNSLLAIGKPAVPQLEEAERAGTPLQKQRASELLKKIRADNK
jgi:hypothetical protein